MERHHRHLTDILDVSVTQGSSAVVHAEAEVRSWKGNLTVRVSSSHLSLRALMGSYENEQMREVLRMCVIEGDEEGDEDVVRAYWIGSADASEKNVHIPYHEREVPLTHASTAMCIVHHRTMMKRRIV